MGSKNSCYVTHDEKNGLIAIGNELIERVFQYDSENEKVFTSALTNKATGQNWSITEFSEFQVVIKTRKETADISNHFNKAKGGLKFESCTVDDLDDGGKRLKVIIENTRTQVKVHLYQEIHPECDWLKKWLGIENNSGESVTITEYNPEMIGTPHELKAHYFSSWRWGARKYSKSNLSHNGVGVHSIDISGRMVQPPMITTDSPLILSDSKGKEFLWYLPEVPIKSVIVREDPRPQLYTDNPWGEEIGAGKSLELSAGVIVGIGSGRFQKAFASFREYLEKWVIKENMSCDKAVLVYNTWYGHGYTETEPCEKSCLEQIDIAKELGLDMYVIDAGWQDELGDWGANKAKFPNGLKAISEYCHGKGLKFGIWVDCRLGSQRSKIYNEHPNWLVKKADNSLYKDYMIDQEIMGMCLASDFGDYLKDKYVKLAEELELDCLKIDHVTLLSYYSFWEECYAQGHNHEPGMSHRLNWNKWIEILEAVKAARPEIIIESVPSGLSLLGVHHVLWMTDYQYRPDWMKEAYYCRALNYHQAYTQPIYTIHQGWASPECTDLGQLDYLCASSIGSNVQCGVTGKIEKAEPEQLAILKKWINWAKTNKKYIGVYQHLFENNPPIPFETSTDDNLMLSLAHRFKPDCIDGFGHLLNDGGWVFLFNPADTEKSVSFTLNLSDYGIQEFSAITDFDSFEYYPKDNTLKLNQTLNSGKYSRSWVQTGYPVSIMKIDTKITSVDFNSQTKEFSLSTSAKPGRYKAVLKTTKLGQPSQCHNCIIEKFNPETSELVISYDMPSEMDCATQSPLQINLSWNK